jgi:hypothetical protein
MALPRLHLFEFNDAPGVPGFVKDTIIESLSRMLAWGRLLRGLVAPFGDFIRKTGATEVLDVCAGAGGPAAILIDELLAAGVTPPRFVLTDRNPQVESWAVLKRRHPRYIDFVPEPVDATRLPPELARGRGAIVINAIHHFRPALAASILCSLAESSAGIFVAEPFERTPLGFALMAPAGVPALLANPILSPKDNVKKAVFTWLTPFAFGVSIWDGFVSTFRVYSEIELRALVAPLSREIEFAYGRYPVGRFGRGYWFCGTRRAAS